MGRRAETGVGGWRGRGGGGGGWRRAEADGGRRGWVEVGGGGWSQCVGCGQVSVCEVSATHTLRSDTIFDAGGGRRGRAGVREGEAEAVGDGRMRMEADGVISDER
jgi:hypothetical protein